MPVAVVLGRVLLAALAIIVARRHVAARPVAWALTALACLDASRMAPWPRLDAAAWLLWPGVSAALSWRAWYTSAARCVPAMGSPGLRLVTQPKGARALRFDSGAARVSLAFLTYAAAAILLPPTGWWRAHAWLWQEARRVPYVAGPCLSVIAWALKSEGLEPKPEPFWCRRSLPSDHAPVVGPSRAGVPVLCPDRECRMREHSPDQSPESLHDADRSTPSARLRQVAAVLAWSGFVDIAVGALAWPGASWSVARGVSCATWIVVGAILVRWIRSPT